VGDHVVAQHTVAKGEIRVVAENVAEFVRVVRTELDLALAERALDLRFERVDELQVVRDTDQTDARLVDRGVLARLGTREIVEEVVAGVRRDVVDLVEDDEDVSAHVLDLLVKELEHGVSAVPALRELVVGISKLVNESTH